MDDAQNKISILIVDDDPKKLLTLETVLTDPAYEVVCVRSGRAALRELLHREFALILLDINMPGMDGFETAGLIRQRSTCENTPIIFITAYGDELYTERSYSLGAVDTILAPVVPQVLRSKVAVFVSLYRQTQKIRRQSERLAQRSAQLSALANQLTEAEHRERRRLAQILHDHLQQLLVAAKMRLSMAGPEYDAARNHEQIAVVSDLIDEAINTSRSLTVELSPPILHDGGLKKAMEWLARKFQKDHGLAVELQIDDAHADLPEHLLSFIYQAVRELLFNIVKHAGVSEARLAIEQTPAEARVMVEDRGSGFGDTAAHQHRPGVEHFGIFSIRERLLFLGGNMQIEPAISAPAAVNASADADGAAAAAVAGTGTRITMSVPLPQRVASSAAAGTLGSAAAGEDGQFADALETQTLSVREDAIRVLLVDDHQMLRKGLVSLLDEHGDIQVIGEAADGQQAVDMAKQLQPQVVVMDLAMPRMGGIEATRHITSAMPDVQVIGLSMHDSDEMAQALCEAGAVSYLNKGGPPDQLLAAIRAARDAVAAP